MCVIVDEAISLITYCNNNCNVAYAWGLMLSWMLVFVEKCIGSHLQCFAIGATQTPQKQQQTLILMMMILDQAH